MTALMEKNMDDMNRITEIIRQAAAALAPGIREMEILRRRKTLTAAEVEQLYGLKSATLKAWRNNGKGPAYVKNGTQVLYRVEDLESYLQNNRVKTADQLT